MATLRLGKLPLATGHLAPAPASATLPLAAADGKMSQGIPKRVLGCLGGGGGGGRGGLNLVEVDGVSRRRGTQRIGLPECRITPFA